MSGKLFALEKDPGQKNARPVAVGEAIRRMAARIVCYQDRDLFTKNFLASLQFGVNVKGGVEFVHSCVQRHFDRLLEEHIENHPAVPTSSQDSTADEGDSER